MRDSPRATGGVAQAIRLKELLGKNVAITVSSEARESQRTTLTPHSSRFMSARRNREESGGIPSGRAQVSISPSCSTSSTRSSTPTGRPSLLRKMRYSRVSIPSSPLMDSTNVRSRRTDWNGIIDKHDLRSSFVFSVEFVASSWSTRTQSHTLTFTRDSLPNLVVEADVLISAAGALNTPIIPDLPGRASFEGTQFHSSRWNDVDLRSKKVAIIGNGSSGIQVVPYIVEREGIQVTQFIRSPGYFTPKVSPMATLPRLS